MDSQFETFLFLFQSHMDKIKEHNGRSGDIIENTDCSGYRTGWFLQMAGTGFSLAFGNGKT